MPTLRVRDLVKDRVLVSRESARLLEGPLRVMMAGVTPAGIDQAIIDFEGAQGVAPSFLDELLSIFEAVIAERTNGETRRLIVAHPPARLTLKFEAIARGHGMSVRALPDGSWLLTDSRGP